jgi:hypothetical protein
MIDLILEKLEKYKPYQKSIIISKCEKIIDVNRFVDSQISIAKTSKSKRGRDLATDRLRLFGIALKQQRDKTKSIL